MALDWDIEADRARREEYEFEGYKFFMKATDPYGFWTIRLESGRTPQSLEGSYTGIVEAKRAVEAYVAEKEQEKAKKVEEEARKAAEEEARRAEFAIKRAEAKKKVEKAQKEEAIKLDNA